MSKKITFFISLLLLLPCLVFAQTYTVKKGDNIWQISKKFNISVNEIKKTNNLKNNKLQIGMKLEIPDKDNKVTQNPKELKNNNTDNTEAKYHIVKKGETLSKIARIYNTSVNEIKKINKLQNNKLNIGQKLIVKAPGKTQENLSTKKDEKIPVLATAKVDINNKIEEIDSLKQNEDLSQLSMTDRLILFAKKMLHLPYRFGGNSFSGLDCSFFVKKVYSMVGVNLPRSAREQFTVGIPVSKSELQPGDLVFFKTYARFPSHVGIYIGDNLFIHASSRSKKITIDSLEAPYYISRFIGAKRIIDADKESLEKALEKVKSNET
ncbi:MAG TPA: LysM peptidoglycan-binding domain-containing protein [Thermodesulfovibrio thiophilus]|nr:LysM peptidoglycan-binding domain-containing protein [Thermodesulfovibrio thiophilus]HQA03980.1 LysM peptidoglycan-binding domain-containing protein [Thermodesulfovibrio thiophilus]HQD36268.1 LysM peptidoglycan-binding domain-containing protein [Thermodesulfovibrio thiophilus]